MAVEMRPRQPYEPLSSNVSRDPSPGGGSLLTTQGNDPIQETHPSPAALADVHNTERPRRLLLKHILRWIASLVFAALIVAVLIVYDRINFSAHKKTVFNTLITAFILGLGLNLFEAFKELARVLRWSILAKRSYTERETDLILGMENLTSVCELGWESSAKPRVWIACLLWLIFNLLAQISVALLSLTFSIDDGRTYNDTYFTSGTVQAPELQSYFNRPRTPLGRGDNQGLAHTYGESFQSDKDCMKYSSFADIYRSTYDSPYFCRRTDDAELHEFAYRFKEYNSLDNERSYPALTDRIITASSGPCIRYEVINKTRTDDFNGNPAAWNFTFANDTSTQSIRIPDSSDGASATTYIYHGNKVPEDEEDESCGDRCLWMWAHRSPLFQDEDQQSSFFQCPIEIGDVTNATSKDHRVPDSVARVAAASIALQQRWSGTMDKRLWIQYQFYPFNTLWETHGHPDSRIGSNMAEFALRSIAGMAEQNPQIEIQGRVPHLGSRLTVSSNWRYLNALLGSIIGAHFLLFVATVWMARKAPVVYDSHTAIAGWLKGKRMGGEILR